MLRICAAHLCAQRRGAAPWDNLFGAPAEPVKLPDSTKEVLDSLKASESLNSHGVMGEQ